MKLVKEHMVRGKIIRDERKSKRKMEKEAKMNEEKSKLMHSLTVVAIFYTPTLRRIPPFPSSLSYSSLTHSPLPPPLLPPSLPPSSPAARIIFSFIFFTRKFERSFSLHLSPSRRSDAPFTSLFCLFILFRLCRGTRTHRHHSTPSPCLATPFCIIYTSVMAGNAAVNRARPYTYSCTLCLLEATREC